MKPTATMFVPENGNVIDLLRAEYSGILKLCETYRKLPESDSSQARSRIAGELCRMVSLCNLIEQEILYPEVRKVNEEVVFDMLLAHDDINACIVEIRALTPDDMDFDLEMMRLINNVRTHIRDSETVLLPLIEREIAPARLKPLTSDFIRRSMLAQGGRDSMSSHRQENGNSSVHTVTHTPRSGITAH